MSRWHPTAILLERTGALFSIAMVLVVTLWAAHPSLLLANTTTAGGDTGSHLALPWFLRTELLPHGELTGWYPGWFDGFPVYTYYFVLADLVAAVLSYVLPYAIAFKLATILGSLLLPICAYALGKGFSLRAPLPACLAAATLPFLFEQSFTIDGGNLFSTFAGEYGFSLALALSLVALGLVARGVRTGRGVIASAVMLSLTLAAHLLPWGWALVGIGLLVVIELVAPWLRDPLPAPTSRSRRTALWFAARTLALSLCLSAWWLAPWATSLSLTTNMGYVNTPDSQLFPGGDHVMLVVALAGLAVAWARRSRFGVWLTTLTLLSCVAYVVDPQGQLFNQRLLPFWFFGAWLTCGWLVGVVVSWLARRHRQLAAERYIADAHAGTRRLRPLGLMAPGWPAAVSGAVVAGLVAAVIVLPPIASVVPTWLLKDVGITPGPNEVPAWAAYNYTGYQNVAGWTADEKDWPEYHAIIEMMQRAGKEHGCGQSTWEYDPSESEFGTTEALMLLPYWTDNCIGSLEGLLFESSATTPYHFLDQSELSITPSDAVNGLPYGPSGDPDVRLGLEHLQLLGVRYFLCFTPSVAAATRRSGLATQIAVTGPWSFEGTQRTWTLFLVKESAVVRPLAVLPEVVRGLSASAWQAAAVSWWINPNRFSVPFAATGPASWPRVAQADATASAVTVAGATDDQVTHVVEGVSSISFDVSRPGVPVEVAISYYPRWHAAGADGPYRISPNLMVVVPTSRHVTLTYGTTPATTVGDDLTWLGLVGCVAGLVWGPARRRLTGLRRARAAAPGAEVS